MFVEPVIAIEINGRYNMAVQQWMTILFVDGIMTLIYISVLSLSYALILKRLENIKVKRMLSFRFIVKYWSVMFYPPRTSIQYTSNKCEMKFFKSNQFSKLFHKTVNVFFYYTLTNMFSANVYKLFMSCIKVC